jgi:predicted glycosyl hydrolase (DUF1957 family)
MTLHPVETIYAASGTATRYGDTFGVCRITGKEGTGLQFDKWVKDTFTDFSYLKPGTIISNEALFCFQEQSELIQQITGKDKPQRFRTYSHFVNQGAWHVLNKADKAVMLPLMLQVPEVCVIAESGQKHLVFKHKPHTWQLEETTVQPDVERFTALHGSVYALAEGFSIDEIQSAQYQGHRIIKFGAAKWKELESQIKQWRGSAMFDLALFFAKISPEQQ